MLGLHIWGYHISSQESCMYSVFGYKNIKIILLFGWSEKKTGFNFVT